jgi:hypothetical protein
MGVTASALPTLTRRWAPNLSRHLLHRTKNPLRGVVPWMEFGPPIIPYHVADALKKAYAELAARADAGYEPGDVELEERVWHPPGVLKKHHVQIRTSRSTTEAITLKSP